MLRPSESDIKSSFATLQIEPNSDWRSVKQAYRKLVREWHPDRQHNNKETAETKIRQINRAYSLLRKHYQFTITPSEQEIFGSKNSKHAKNQPSQTIISITLDAVKRYAKHPNKNHDQSLSLARYAKDQLIWLKQLIAAIFSRRQTKWIVLSTPFIVVIYYSLSATLSSLNKNPSIVLTNTTDLSVEQDRSHDTTLASQNNFITVGDDMVKVLEVEGPPTASSSTAWYYGKSAIFLKDGVVVSWYVDPSRSLNVREARQSVSFIKKGLDKNMVLALLGPPTEMKSDRWYYGSSMIRFEEDVVADWYNSRSSPLRSFLR